MHKYFRQKKLTLLQQDQRMRTLHPQLKLVRLTFRGVVWQGNITPSPLSETYQVRVSYGLNGVPRIFVISPKLIGRADNPKIPHLYRDGGLCLYLPRLGEWNSYKFIADTIVPWTSLWLVYYEAWHAMGEWYGGGTVH